MECLHQVKYVPIEGTKQCKAVCEKCHASLVVISELHPPTTWDISDYVLGELRQEINQALYNSIGVASNNE